jgi:hypothetical protein
MLQFQLLMTRKWSERLSCSGNSRNVRWTSQAFEKNSVREQSVHGLMMIVPTSRIVGRQILTRSVYCSFKLFFSHHRSRTLAPEAASQREFQIVRMQPTLVPIVPSINPSYRPKSHLKKPAHPSMAVHKKDPRPDPKVSVGSLSDLFSSEAKSFKLRKDTPDENEATPTPGPRDWKQIAFTFLSQPSDISPLGDPQPFRLIDTTRASEFVAGRGSQKWNELRKEALDASREKHRRARN